VRQIARGLQDGPSPTRVDTDSGRSPADELLELEQLRDRGVLSPEEFDTQKARLLATS
jgi:hypothetical protein